MATKRTVSKASEASAIASEPTQEELADPHRTISNLKRELLELRKQNLANAAALERIAENLAGRGKQSSPAVRDENVAPAGNLRGAAPSGAGRSEIRKILLHVLTRDPQLGDRAYSGDRPAEPSQTSQDLEGALSELTGGKHPEDPQRDIIIDIAPEDPRNYINLEILRHTALVGSETMSLDTFRKAAAEVRDLVQQRKAKAR